jgi:hypothetical protein
MGPGLTDLSSAITVSRLPALIQGLTLVRLSAQLEPCLSQENIPHTVKHPLTSPSYGLHNPLRTPPIPHKALKLS